MITVWKYPVEMTDEFEIEMPKGMFFLCVQMQGDTPQIWALVNTDAPLRKFRWRLAGTGHELSHTSDYGKQATIIDFRSDYRGTFQIRGLVFHLFLLPPWYGRERDAT